MDWYGTVGVGEGAERVTAVVHGTDGTVDRPGLRVAWYLPLMAREVVD